jgi:hypothetical protein
MKTLTINDESALGTILNQFSMNIEFDTIRVKDLIEARVYHEVQEYNDRLPEVFNGLVQPSYAEKVLNGFKLKEKRKIDPEKQLYIALDAFQKNGYFILIDNRQAEDLEEEVLVSTSTTVSFVKLMALVGG